MDNLRCITFVSVTCNPLASPSEDVFVIKLSGNSKEWEVCKSSTEIDKFHIDLFDSGLLYLPKYPDIPNSSYIKLTEYHCCQLLLYIEACMRRADIATSIICCDFFNFWKLEDLHITPITHLLVEPSTQCKLTATSIATDVSSSSIYVGFEDTTEFARLGKVWKIIEDEECGGLVTFYLDANSGDMTNQLYEKRSNKVRKLLYDKIRRYLIIGDGGGAITISTIIQDPIENRIIKCIEAHTECIMDMKLSQSYIISTGYDKSFRVIDLNVLQVVSGGRLYKRLPTNVYINSCDLDAGRKLAFIGTSNGDILVYSFTSTSPVYLQIISVAENFLISTILLHERQLFIGVEESVLLYALEYEKNTLKFRIVARYDCIFEETSKVQCMEYMADSKHLVVGYDGGVGIWSLLTGECVCGWAAHGGSPVHSIAVLDALDILITGGEDGTFKMWYTNYKRLYEWRRRRLSMSEIEYSTKLHTSSQKTALTPKNAFITSVNQINESNNYLSKDEDDIKRSDKTSELKKRSTGFVKPSIKTYCRSDREAMRDWKNAFDGR